MNNETENQFQCSECKITKTRIFHKIYGKTKKYIDDKGKLWNGAQCPVCASAYRGYSILPRKQCRNCKLLKKEVFYFYCKKCHEYLSREHGIDYGYGVSSIKEVLN